MHSTEWPPGRISRTVLAMLMIFFLCGGALLKGSRELADNTMTPTLGAQLSQGLAFEAAPVDFLAGTIESGSEMIGHSNFDYAVINSERGVRTTVGGPSDQPPSTQPGETSTYVMNTGAGRRPS